MRIPRCHSSFHPILTQKQRRSRLSVEPLLSLSTMLWSVIGGTINCEREIAALVVDNAGDYLFQVKPSRWSTR